MNHSFGGFFTIDIREKNILLNNITLQFQLGSVVGSSSPLLTGYFNPAWFFFTRIEVVEGGNVITIVQDLFETPRSCVELLRPRLDKFKRDGLVMFEYFLFAALKGDAYTAWASDSY